MTSSILISRHLVNDPNKSFLGYPAFFIKIQKLGINFKSRVEDERCVLVTGTSKSTQSKYNKTNHINRSQFLEIANPLSLVCKKVGWFGNCY